MKRTTTKVDLGDNTERVRVRIEGDDCEANGVVARKEQYRLLQQVAEQPDLTHCALEPFQRLTMHHDGKRWIVEVEAVVRKTNGAV